MERKVLTVFLASPGDLKDEREGIRAITDRLNKVYGRRLGWHIELLGWEDTLPGFTRPQAMINKDVESCDMFIGMLWKRWGQSSGKYSSGFEEEFMIARELRLQTGKPEIWLFFKSVDEELCKDPGEQLQRTLQFKREQIEKKELLFKEFETTEQFCNKVYDDLSAFVIDLYKEQSIESPIISSNVSLSPEKVTGEFPEKELGQKATSDELLDLITVLSDRIRNKSISDIDFWQRTRIYLTVSALFSESHLGELFGTHETNLAYRKRKTWKLSPVENFFIVRSCISDESAVNPGWYWLSSKGENYIDELLLYLALYDKNELVRKRSISKLIEVKYSPSIEFVEQCLKESNEDVLYESIKLAELCESPEVVGIIEPLISHSNEKISQAAISTCISNLYLHDPEDAFKKLIKKAINVPKRIIITLEDLSLNVGIDLLFIALREANPRIREFTARYLRKSGALTIEICNELLKDPDSTVREIGFLSLLDKGEMFDLEQVSNIFAKPKVEEKGLIGFAKNREIKEEDVIPYVLIKMSFDQLIALVDFYKKHGREVYEVLATDYFEKFETILRKDIEDGFATLQKESKDRMREEYGNVGETILKSYTLDLEEFTRAQFISCALKGLSMNGKESDIVYARKYLGVQCYGMGNDFAIQIMKKYGDQSDVAPLLMVARNSYGETLKNAVETAIYLSIDKKKIIEDLLKDGNNLIARYSLNLIRILDRSEQLDIAKGLLNANNEDLRISAVGIMNRCLGRADLEDLLDSYIESGTYYYNVVCYLDAILYAPGKYVKRNQDKVKEAIDNII